MMDVLSGALTGSGVATEVHGPYEPAAPSRAGHLFLAIDPAAMGDPADYEARVQRLIDEVKVGPARAGLRRGVLPRRARGPGGGGEPRRGRGGAGAGVARRPAPARRGDRRRVRVGTAAVNPTLPQQGGPGPPAAQGGDRARRARARARRCRNCGWSSGPGRPGPRSARRCAGWPPRDSSTSSPARGPGCRGCPCRASATCSTSARCSSPPPCGRRPRPRRTTPRSGGRSPRFARSSSASGAAARRRRGPGRSTTWPTASTGRSSRATRNEHLRRTIADLRPHTARLRNLSHIDPQRVEVSVGEHLRMCDALLAGDADEAAAAAAEHLTGSLATIFRNLADGAGERSGARLRSHSVSRDPRVSRWP